MDIIDTSEAKVTKISDQSFSYAAAPKNVIKTFYGPDHHKIGDRYESSNDVMATKLAEMTIHISKFDDGEMSYSLTMTSVRTWNKKNDTVIILKKILKNLENTH